jgi:hypothetical protein
VPNDDGCDIRICDPWIKEADAYCMDHNDSVRTGCCDVGYQIITVGVAQLGAVSALRGPCVNEDEAGTAGGIDAWGV